MTSFIAHVNASRGFRGGERQTELLIEELQKYGYKQALIARKNRALARRTKHKDIDLREVSGNPISVALACRGVDLIHVHEGRSVYGAYLKWFFSKTPYIITRRVDNPIRQHRFARKAYGNASAIAAVAPQVAKIVKQYDTQLNPKVVHSGSSNLPVNEENDDVEDIDFVQKEDIVITISHRGYIKRVPLDKYKSQKRGGRGRAGRAPAKRMARGGRTTAARKPAKRMMAAGGYSSGAQCGGPGQQPCGSRKMRKGGKTRTRQHQRASQS